MDTATEKLVATKEESGDVDPSESETGSEEDVTGKPVAYKTASEKPYASSKSDCQGCPKAEKIRWSRNLHVSPRKQDSRSPGGSTDETMTTLWIFWT